MKEKNKKVTMKDLFCPSWGKAIIFAVEAGIFALICWMVNYFGMPSYSMNNTSTWWLAFLSVLYWTVCVYILLVEEFEYDKPGKNVAHMFAVATVILFVLICATTIKNGNMGDAKGRYNFVAKMVTKIASNEAQEMVFPTFDEKTIPMAGVPEAEASAQTLLGSMPGLGSQMELIENEYTSQNINGQLTYVVPLEPSSMFRWEKKVGNGGYFIFNRNTRNTEFVQDSLLLVNNAPFSSNIKRHMYNYLHDTLDKSYGLMEITPEVDDNGVFYYVGTVYDCEKVGGMTVVKGVIITNAISGENQYYTVDETPEWVDRVYPESLFLEYIDIYGKYANGYWNTTCFGKKKGVQVPTKDYDVVYVDGVCYAYTGWTTYKSGSNSDSSNGIIMMNLKNGEITLYENNGISENKAMKVAEGKVQEKEYNASYPILVQVAEQPTYFMLMRDKNDNITGYAFVSYKDYTKVAVAEYMQDAKTAYIKALATANTSEGLDNVEIEKKAGVISNITSEVVEANTVYYVQIDGAETIFCLTSNLDKKVVFATVGDYIEVSYMPTEEEVISVVEVSVTYASSTEVME